MWFGLLLIIHCVFASTTQYNKILGYECETNSNCTNLVPNSICLNKKCICQFGYKSDGCVLEENELRYRRQINYGKKRMKLLVFCFVYFNSKNIQV